MIEAIAKSPALEFPRRLVVRTISKILSSRGLMIAPSLRNTPKDVIYELIRCVFREKDMLLTEDEAYQLYSCAANAARVPGDMAEVGVFRGGSARLICEAKRDKTLFLFDTFEGLPDVQSSDGRFEKGQYKASLEEVTKYLNGYPGVSTYKGLFPATSEPVRDKRFCFVHLDVDIYSCTRAGLEFFYPRMSPGGVILIHDYLWGEGVRKAVHEFIADKPGPILELAGAYCAIIKVTNGESS